MKIRIKGNSLRFRLSKTEVDLFAREGMVEEITEFGNSTLTYTVRAEDGNTLSASFLNNQVILLVPPAMLQKWASTNLVGLTDKMPVGDGKQLQLLLEKDFKCIDADVSEDQSDYFENPVKAC